MNLDRLLTLCGKLFVEKAVDLKIIQSTSEIRMKVELRGVGCYLLWLHLIVQSRNLPSAEHLAFPYLGFKWKQD